MTRPFAAGRPLPLQAPTAFVRIRPRGARGCGESGPPQAVAAVLIRVGSRGSRLALTQAERAVEALRRPGIEIALVPITTVGDRDRTKPFGEIGERGVFVKELEEALLAGRIDAAVHSAKDMTSTDTAGLAVGAYPPVRTRATRSAAPRPCGRACASAPRRCVGERSSWRWSRCS